MWSTYNTYFHNGYQFNLICSVRSLRLTLITDLIRRLLIELIWCNRSIEHFVLG